MLKLEIFLFGNFEIHLDGVEITDSLRTRKERALLAYLAEEPAILQTREKIAEFFWPNRPENYARMNLRQALLGLRRTIEGENQTHKFLEITDETIEFNHQDVWMDTQTFSTYTQSIKQHPHQELHTCQECMQNLEDSIDLYRGDFLLDLILNEVTAFQEWVILQRERHFRNHVEVLITLSKAYYHQSNWDKAYKYAYQYVEVAPLEEAAHRLLMRLLTLNGRRTAALQQYQMCKSIISRELGIAPSLETQQLYEKIQNNLPIERIDTGILSHRVPDLQMAGSQESPTHPLYDPITNIPMRIIFLDRLQHALMRSRRNQIDTVLVVLSIGFPKQPTYKPIQKNQIDTLIVRRLLGMVREDDSLGRLSENEYGIILEDIKDPAVVPMIIDKIKRSIEKPIQLFDKLINTNLSIGWNFSSQDGYNAEEVFSKAEIAMRTDQLHKSLHKKQS